MKLKNLTDISDRTIEEIVEFVRPPGIKHLHVWVSHHGGRNVEGVACCLGPDDFIPFVEIGVATEAAFDPKVRVKIERGYLPIEIGSREEALVRVLAHELRHIWQEKRKERDADLYALLKLREWRRRGKP